MAYDGPFDDEYVCRRCGAYAKRLSPCQNCGTPQGQGTFSKNNIATWMFFIGVMSMIIIPLFIVVLMSIACQAHQPGAC